MAEGAVAKFTGVTDKLNFSFSFDLDGTHSVEERKKRDGAINGVTARLTNLETLINTDVWDAR